MLLALFYHSCHYRLCTPHFYVKYQKDRILNKEQTDRMNQANPGDRFIVFVDNIKFIAAVLFGGGGGGGGEGRGRGC